MDSLTQILIGIATVEAVAGKQLKNKTFPIGAILGTLPDIDIWIGKLFPYQTELAMHRAFTHSIIGILILSPIISYIFNKILPSLSFKKWNIVVAATLATHILIDLFTAWGVQLFYPLTDRFSFKTIFVVDIFYTLPWLIALIIVWRHQQDIIRKKTLWIGFVVSSIYLCGTVATKLWVVQKTKQSIHAQNIDAKDFIVKPTFSNLLLWNINIKANDGYYLGTYSILDKKAISYEFFPRDISLEHQFQQDPAFTTLQQVSEGWYTITKLDSTIYAFNDLRFGYIETPANKKQFVFAYALQPSDKGWKVAPLPKTLNDGSAALKKIGNRMLGN